MHTVICEKINTSFLITQFSKNGSSERRKHINIVELKIDVSIIGFLTYNILNKKYIYLVFTKNEEKCKTHQAQCKIDVNNVK